MILLTFTLFALFIPMLVVGIDFIPEKGNYSYLLYKTVMKIFCVVPMADVRETHLEDEVVQMRLWSVLGSFLVGVLSVNVFIAVISESYDKSRQHMQHMFVVKRAQICFEYFLGFEFDFALSPLDNFISK